MSHGPHVNRHPNAFFDDECEDCQDKAKDPIPWMDQTRARQMWHKMIDVEIFGNGSYHSESDKKACTHLYRIYLFLQRNTTTDPQLLEFLA